MENLNVKIQKSFESEFGMEPDSYRIIQNIAIVTVDIIEYSCKLTKTGVKKNSWRLETEN